MVDYKKHLATQRALANIRNTVSVDLNQAHSYTKKAKEPEPIPDLFDAVDLTPEQQRRVLFLLPLILEQKQIERVAARTMEPWVNELKALLPEEKLKALLGETRISYYPQTRITISKTLLLEQGISPAAIAAASVPSTAWVLKLGFPGQTEGDSDE